MLINLHPSYGLNELGNFLLCFGFSICEGRAIYAGYFPALRTIHVVVVNPFQNRDLTPSFLEKQFRDACQALDIESPLLQHGAKFKVDYLFFFIKIFLAHFLCSFNYRPHYVNSYRWIMLDMSRMLKGYY